MAMAVLEWWKWGCVHVGSSHSSFLITVQGVLCREWPSIVVHGVLCRADCDCAELGSCVYIHLIGIVELNPAAFSEA